MSSAFLDEILIIHPTLDAFSIHGTLHYLGVQKEGAWIAELSRAVEAKKAKGEVIDWKHIDSFKGQDQTGEIYAHLTGHNGGFGDHAAAEYAVRSLREAPDLRAYHAGLHLLDVYAEEGI